MEQSIDRYCEARQSITQSALTSEHTHIGCRQQLATGGMGRDSVETTDPAGLTCGRVLVYTAALCYVGLLTQRRSAFSSFIFVLAPQPVGPNREKQYSMV